MNRDKLFTGGNPERIRQSAYRVITRTQDEPDVQVLGMALAMYCTCEALDINIRDLLVAVERMKADLDGPFVATFRALEAYAREEIGR